MCGKHASKYMTHKQVLTSYANHNLFNHRVKDICPSFPDSKEENVKRIFQRKSKTQKPSRVKRKLIVAVFRGIFVCQRRFAYQETTPHFSFCSYEKRQNDDLFIIG